ncbi:MAG: hypothetical protein U9P07_03095 [Pseudomonadota bacterium]|nr:hypothetical protein [Pseudomonadota bacterium]
MQTGIRVITGNPPLVAGTTLQFLLHPGRNERHIIIDYSGRLAFTLQRQSMAITEQKKVRWYDLADRQAPVALFQLRDTPFKGKWGLDPPINCGIH